jgi:ABC-2 type transport system permease protein
MILIAAGLSLIFHASISPAPWSVALFIPVLLLAFFVRFFLEWTLALAAFWTTRVGAINQTYFVLMLFLSGQIAPLALLPSPVQVVAGILPFRWMIGFPVELLLGRLTLAQALTGLGAQFAWLLISVVLLQIVWRAGVRIYSAVGA